MLRLIDGVRRCASYVVYGSETLGCTGAVCCFMPISVSWRMNRKWGKSAQNEQRGKGHINTIMRCSCVCVLLFIQLFSAQQDKCTWAQCLPGMCYKIRNAVMKHKTCQLWWKNAFDSWQEFKSSSSEIVVGKEIQGGLRHSNKYNNHHDNNNYDD